MIKNSFHSLLENSFRNNWDLPALSDNDEDFYRYKDMAKQMAEVHATFKALGIRKGDRVALCGLNSANWAIAFFASLTYGVSTTTILNDFIPEIIENIVTHSESKLLFASDSILNSLDINNIPQAKSIISLDDFSLKQAPSKETEMAYEEARIAFRDKYEDGFQFSDMRFHTEEQPEEMAILNYTSGTTSKPKGVMIPYRSIWSNIVCAIDRVPYLKPGETIVSILPMGHMFGLAFELMFGITNGCRLHFLTKLPTPQYLFATFNKYKPAVVFSVPLVLEKIVKKMVMPSLKGTIPQTEEVKKAVRDNLIKIFGGNLQEVCIAGAALSKETGELLSAVSFPYMVGYGMTECATAITFEDHKTFKTGSCGKVVDRMEIKIESEDPMNIPGELLTRGDNVMLGYYKNEEATQAVLSDDGWLRTGDLALIDADGNYYLKGRSKTMILGSSGQNIYPEEIEELFNALPIVAESLVVEKGNKLVAMIYPDFECVSIESIKEKFNNYVEEIKEAINKRLPSYSHISEIMLRFEEFEKTPKRSIRRFLYQ